VTKFLDEFIDDLKAKSTEVNNRELPVDDLVTLKSSITSYASVPHFSKALRKVILSMSQGE